MGRYCITADVVSVRQRVDQGQTTGEVVICRCVNRDDFGNSRQAAVWPLLQISMRNDTFHQRDERIFVCRSWLPPRYRPMTRSIRMWAAPSFRIIEAPHGPIE